MRILIVYASNSGNTLMVAERLVSHLNRHQVTLKEATQVEPADFASAEAVVFGSCTWLLKTAAGPEEGQLPQQLARMTASWRELPVDLTNRPCAVFALGRHEYTKVCGAADHLEQLVTDLGGRPITESLRIDGFPHHQLEVVDAWATQLETALGRAGKATA